MAYIPPMAGSFVFAPAPAANFTTALQPVTSVDLQEKETSPQSTSGGEESGSWHTTSANAYGAFIGECRVNGLVPGLLKCGGQALASFAAQICFSLYIYGIARDLCPGLDDDVWECLSGKPEVIGDQRFPQCDDVGAPMSAAALIVFLAMQLAQINSVFSHFQLVWFSDAVQVDVEAETKYDGDATVKDITVLERLFILAFAVLPEAVLWVLMVLTGIMFVFQASSNEEVYACEMRFDIQQRHCYYG
jgi:hypothetical protein